MNKLGKLAPKLGYKKKTRKNQRKTAFMKCQHCGKYFEFPASEKNRKYCSRTCASRAFNNTRKVHTIKTSNCLHCGDEFTFKSFPKKKDQRFCCTDCCNKYYRPTFSKRRAEKDYEELMCNV